MNCNQFQHWLRARDIFACKKNPEAVFHLETCFACKKLYRLDTGLEENIQSGFIRQEIPKNLMDRVDTKLDQEIKSPARLNRSLIAAFAVGIAIIVAFSIFPEPDKPFRYQSLQHLSEAAVIDHLKGNMAMSFTTEKMGEALALLRKELEFNVIIPDLSEKGYTLLGGRLCSLGQCRTAYIFYQKAGKTSSLFILDDDHLDFKMADTVNYSNDINECRTDIWKENGQVYALVSSI